MRMLIIPSTEIVTGKCWGTEGKAEGGKEDVA